MNKWMNENVPVFLIFTCFTCVTGQLSKVLSNQPPQDVWDLSDSNIVKCKLNIVNQGYRSVPSRPRQRNCNKSNYSAIQRKMALLLRPRQSAFPPFSARARLLLNLQIDRQLLINCGTPGNLWHKAVRLNPEVAWNRSGFAQGCTGLLGLRALHSKSWEYPFTLLR